MAKAKQKPQPWDAVFDRVRVFRAPDSLYVRPSTDGELDEVESQLSLKLPASYRAFMTRFGSGSLMDWVRLTSPVAVSKRDRGLVDSTLRIRAFWKKYAEEYPNQDPNSDFLCRCVHFASDFGGNLYLWDPLEVTEPKARECRFFSLERHIEDPPVPVGNSFAEFIGWVEQRSINSEGPEPKPPGIQFTPLYLRGKKQPLKRDVKLWLAYNRNTARDLALSIRDRGQTDAFPILADALQEAGCENADLLNSCRTGDPDIDGKWVLQVLLGKA